MKIEKENTSLPTWMGALCSVLLFLIVAAYFGQKIDILVTREDVNIVTASLDSFFDQDYVLDFDAGLNFAIAFTAYDGTDDSPLNDPSIVEVVFNAYQWGGEATDGGEYFAGRSNIPTHTCTREELGLDGNNSKFFPIVEESHPELDFHSKKFICVDQEDMFISGDYSSAKARLMNFQLVKCHGHDYCKSDEEIKAYLRNKFLLMVSNQIRFESRKDK